MRPVHIKTQGSAHFPTVCLEGIGCQSHKGRDLGWLALIRKGVGMDIVSERVFKAHDPMGSASLRVTCFPQRNALQ